MLLLLRLLMLLLLLSVSLSVCLSVCVSPPFFFDLLIVSLIVSFLLFRYLINNFSDGFKEDCLAFSSVPLDCYPSLSPHPLRGLRRVALEYLLLLLLLCLSVHPFFRAMCLLHETGAAGTRLLLSIPLFLVHSGLLMPALFRSLPVVGWLAEGPHSLFRVLQGTKGEARRTSPPSPGGGDALLDVMVDVFVFLGGCSLLLLAFILGGAVYIHLRRHACISYPLLQRPKLLVEPMKASSS